MNAVTRWDTFKERRVLIYFLAMCLSSLCALPADVPPDFALKDVGQNSPCAGATVSPKDYLLQVSAYYFIHAG